VVGATSSVGFLVHNGPLRYHFVCYWRIKMATSWGCWNGD